MKRRLSSAALIAVVLCGVSFAMGQDPELEDVKQAVIEGYINGVFLKTDLTLIEKYWHPECDIYQYQGGKLAKIPAVAQFRELSTKVKAPYDPTVTYSFLDVHVKGYAALAIVEIHSHGAYRYTDILNLYKFDDGWKIVTKTYHRNTQ